ncbi:MAG: 30S ribosomal protein S3 [Clostridiales bacterium]|nr:30S ribosomal protein S3 [Clostridiales bacterium]
MGQKVNPHGLRVGVIKDWSSRWFVDSKDFGDTLVEDYKIRKFLKKALYQAAIEKIDIERKANKIFVLLYTAKPGIIIGRGGSEIDKLRAQVTKMVGQDVRINIVEVKNPDLSGQLVAENIASQLERRISYRKAMKQAMGRTMKSGAKGIKTSCSGRLGGVEIARSEHYNEGTIPLQTLRADIDYGFAEANTTYGKIGVKVWIYKGEVLNDGKKGVSSFNSAMGDRPNNARNNRGARNSAGRGPGGYAGANGGRNNARANNQNSVKEGDK